jgi:hypothetical protein
MDINIKTGDYPYNSLAANYGAVNSSETRLPGASGETGASAISGANGGSTNGVYKSTPAECQTCKERTYVDGSNEGDVSFKTPGHIDPGASAAVVMGHEKEHVANAYQEESSGNAKVLSASVSLRTAICPECGRSYVSGGTTATAIRYTNNDKHTQNTKAVQSMALIGQNVDAQVTQNQPVKGYL